MRRVSDECHWLRQCELTDDIEHWQSQWHTASAVTLRAQCAPAGFAIDSARRPRVSTRPPRRAYTLVELLVTITIIAILASFMFGAVYLAQQSAKSARTKSLIAKLHQQIMLRWESYRTRRVPIVTSGMNPRLAAAKRLLALRELMRFELPDGWADVVRTPGNGSVQPPTTTNFPSLPSISSAYTRRVEAAYNALTAPLPNGGGLSPQRAWDVLSNHEGAECLYMIVSMGLEDDSQGNEHFSLSDVADADGDGLPEYHDAWGNPISFLRWAPEFVSDLQPVLPGSPPTSPPTRDPLNNHDPFDPLKLDGVQPLDPHRGFALFPLIYSAGPDGKSDLVANGAVGDLNDPYKRSFGRVIDVQNDGDNSLDNIHNHLITAR